MRNNGQRQRRSGIRLAWRDRPAHLGFVVVWASAKEQQQTQEKEVKRVDDLDAHQASLASFVRPRGKS